MIDSLEDVVTEDAGVRKRSRTRRYAGESAVSKKPKRKRKETKSLQAILQVVQGSVAKDPFGLSMKPCTFEQHAQKKNCLNNPNCLFGLGERDGLSSLLLKSLGPNPQLQARGTDEHGQRVPMGLRNLGATCYVNALLQTLFMNPTVRAGVYEWKMLPSDDPKLAEHMKEMQSVFAHLQYSVQKAHSLTHFAKLLDLSTGIQQDAQEFNKLLLSHMDKIVAKNENERVRNMLKIFEGEMEYVTTCSSCKTASRRAASFLELDLPIQGLKHLGESLQSYASVEVLDGHNKFECSVCQGKHDAERRLQLRKLPDVLNLQLLRFVYEMKLYTKKKVKDSLGIPTVLDLAHYPEILSPVLQEDLKDPAKQGRFRFHLTAILNHKGATADSGHYTADVLDRFRETHKWWTFDDEKVEPFLGLQEVISSKTAYMLIYENDWARKNPEQVPPPPPLIEQVEIDNTRFDADVAAFARRKCKLEAAMENRKDEYARLFKDKKNKPYVDGDCEAHEYFWISKEWLESWIAGVDKSTPVLDLESQPGPKADVHTVIDVDIKEEIAVFDQVTDKRPMELFASVPNLRKFLCKHSNEEAGLIRISPKSVNYGGLKRVNARLWFGLLQSVGGDANASTLLTLGSLRHPGLKCEDCVMELDQHLEHTEKEQRIRTKIEKILELESIPKQAIPLEMLHQYKYISKSWISHWRKWSQKEVTRINSMVKRLTNGKNVGKTETTANSDQPSLNINKAITCPHGNLTPGNAGKRLVLDADFDYIRVNAMNNACNESTSVFRGDTEFCQRCLTQSSQDKEAIKHLRSKVTLQLNDKMFGSTLRSLRKRKVGHPNMKQGKLVDGDYYIVPRSWMSKWRVFLDNPVDNASPGPLLDSFQALTCEHKRIVVNQRLIKWFKKQNDHQSKTLLPFDQENENDITSEHVELLHPKERDALAHFYPRINETGEGIDSITLRLPIGFDPSNVDEPTLFEIEPALCCDCMKKMTDRPTNFTNEEVIVCILPPGQRVPNQTPNGSRRSARATTSSKTSNKVKVSSTTSVNMLKLLAFQHELIRETYLPSEITFYHNGKPLEPKQTLADIGTCVGDIFYAVPVADAQDTGTYDDWVALAEGADFGPERSSMEQGFLGTALVS